MKPRASPMAAFAHAPSACGCRCFSSARSALRPALLPARPLSIHDVGIHEPLDIERGSRRSMNPPPFARRMLSYAPSSRRWLPSASKSCWRGSSRVYPTIGPLPACSSQTGSTRTYSPCAGPLPIRPTIPSTSQSDTAGTRGSTEILSGDSISRRRPFTSPG